MHQLLALIRKDLKIFFGDKKAVFITFTVPIAIASFMASIMGGTGSSSVQKKIEVLVVDQDQSDLSKKLIKDLASTPLVDPKPSEEGSAVQSVKSGDTTLAIIIPHGFGAQAPKAFYGGDRPQLRFAYDPSKTLEFQAVQGAVMQVFMQDISTEAFAGESAIMGGQGEGVRRPFDIRAEPQTAAEGANAWSGSAHMFAGMGVQGLLFFAIDAAMGLLRDRRTGVWKRLNASPVSLFTLLAAKGIGSAILAAFIFVGILLFGMAMFHFRIAGSFVGLGLIIVSTALMVAAFGLLVASLGRTEGQSRGLSTLAVLGMSMLGGAWFPSFLMPEWVQQISMFVPVHWAVEGCDNMFWRGEGLSAAMPSVGGLLAFTIIFGGFAILRFRSMPETGMV